MTTTSRPWLMLGALGLLTAAGPAAAVDTSEWKCETCPAPDGAAGSVEVGAAYVSSASQRFGDETGLARKGAYLVLGGELRWRGVDDQWLDARASDLGDDARALQIDGGRGGRYALRLSYRETPRSFADGAVTPFQGVGGTNLGLPAGYPAGNTATMPLASTLEGVRIGYQRSRLAVDATVPAGANWNVSASLVHQTREGTQPLSAGFFSSAEQLVAPLSQESDDLEVAANYLGREFQARLAYQYSVFHDRNTALTWSDPFSSGTLGATQGQLALAPDNEVHQIKASLGWRISPTLRASADLASGRMTQDQGYLASTLNPTLLVPGLPATSLHGVVDTVDAALRLSANPLPGLSMAASVTHDERNNHTPSLAYPSVSTDLFLGPNYSNQPYGFKQDKVRLSAEGHAAASARLGLGLDYDHVERTLQEASSSHETTVWARVAGRVSESLGVSLKLSHGDRRVGSYETVAAITPAENPLLTRFNMANRLRDQISARSDINLGDSIAIGIDYSYAHDDYPDTLIGLKTGRVSGLGADFSWAISADSRLTIYGHSDWTRSAQAGSQAYAVPDWIASTKGSADLFGIGVTQVVIKDKLDIGVDVVGMRSRNDIAVDNGVPAAGFPSQTTALDSFKLRATWRINAKMDLTTSYWYEHYGSADWQLQGLNPATVPNYLALGVQPPRYDVSVLRMALRYRF
ncbi:MAG: MtrB/PioB family decaheme-associated outer membrane protein [Burkholderiales bacterium]|nr:MtrB/PioB family decaheme-associated outer membrane protein [Burkholderiales bacterium]